MGAEATWVGLKDSERWRRIARSGLASRLRGSPVFRSAGMARRYAGTRYRSLREPARFETVETVCLFLGHVKSGGTLTGALLDAHPDALVSDEVDVVRYMKAGFGRQQIFHLIERGSRREALKGRVTARRLDPYSLAVPGQSQGGADQVRVLGDTRAGPTTRQLGSEPDLLDRLDGLLEPTAPRFIHVVRNPYDPISAMVRRSGRSFSNAIEDHRDQCDRLLDLRRRIAPERVLTLRYEDLTADPAGRLARVCEFLGLAADDGYLEACSGIVDGNRPGERTMVDWDEDSIAEVGRTIDAVDFLEGYRWG